MMKYRAILRPGEKGYIVASVPSLPGCFSQGKTIDEAIKNIKEAALAYLEATRKVGDPLANNPNSLG